MSSGSSSDGKSTAAIIAAAFALIGTGINGYFQYTSNVDRYSIEKARLFKELIGELITEDHGKLALLNLWQLYPDEHRIIVLAALQTGNSEVVETMMRFDEDLRPHVDLLYVHAESADPQISEAAKRLLNELDPVKTSEILINRLDHKRVVNDEDADLRDLIVLGERNTDVVERVVLAYSKKRDKPLYLEYALYRLGQADQFIDRFKDLGQNKLLENVIEYGTTAVFEEVDARTVATNLLAYAMSLAGESATTGKWRDYELGFTLLCLMNDSIRRVLSDVLTDEFKKVLVKIVTDQSGYETVRHQSVRILEFTSPRLALFSVASVFAAADDPNLQPEFLKDAVRRLIARLKSDLPGMQPPPEILDGPNAWSTWCESAKPLLLSEI